MRCPTTGLVLCFRLTHDREMAGLTRRSCGTNSIVLFAVLVIAACVWTSEGTLADNQLRDVSRDTSDEDSDAVFKSISPLEAAIMPVSRTMH